jgi:hypothetical protein
MVSTPPAWGPREGKSLCIIELNLDPDIAYAECPLDEVLRMCIDFCSHSVLKERRRLDSPPAPPEPLFGRTFSEYFKGQREGADRSSWIPSLEVIPPTTLFTVCKHPGIRIHLGLPAEIAVEVRKQFEQVWQELIADIKRCGVGPFLDLYRRPNVTGIPVGKAEYPFNRWGPLVTGGLVCVKNPQPRTVSHEKPGDAGERRRTC